MRCRVKPARLSSPQVDLSHTVAAGSIAGVCLICLLDRELGLQSQKGPRAKNQKSSASLPMFQ